MAQKVWENRLNELFGRQAYHQVNVAEFGNRLEVEAGVNTTLRNSFQNMDVEHRLGLLKDLQRLTKEGLGPSDRLKVYRSLATRFDRLFSWEEVIDPTDEAPPFC